MRGRQLGRVPCLCGLSPPSQSLKEWDSTLWRWPLFNTRSSLSWRSLSWMNSRCVPPCPISAPPLGSPETMNHLSRELACSLNQGEFQPSFTDLLSFQQWFRISITLSPLLAVLVSDHLTKHVREHQALSKGMTVDSINKLRKYQKTPKAINGY